MTRKGLTGSEVLKLYTNQMKVLEMIVMIVLAVAIMKLMTQL